MLLAMGVFLSSCAGLQPVESDREMGQQVAKQVEMEIGISQDAERTNYLNAVGERLVRTLEDQRFDSSIPSSFRCNAEKVFQEGRDEV